MRLFGVKTEGAREGQIKAYLEENYISAGYPGLGDLENISKEELNSRLAAAGAYQGKALSDAMESLHTFVNVMQDGDYVLIADEEWVYLGDLGDYFYDDRHDSVGDGTAHRRGVTWLKSLPRTGLNAAVETLLTADRTVTGYAGELPAARVDLWLASFAASGAETGRSPVQVDEATVAEALSVLKAALHSNDAGRRERAAAAILHYAK